MWPVMVMVIWSGAFAVNDHLVFPDRARETPVTILTQPAEPALPSALTATETGAISRHENPKSRVEESLRIAEARLLSAVGGSRKGLYQPALEEIIVYAALVRYADQVARAIPPRKRNDRESSLKKIEQTIFRQAARLDAVISELPVDLRDSASPLYDQIKRIRLQAINDLLGGGSAIRVPEEP